MMKASETRVLAYDDSDDEEEEEETVVVRIQDYCYSNVATTKGACSLWQIIFVCLAALGIFFIAYGFPFEDWLLVADAALLFALAIYCAICLGGDPCLLDALRKQCSEIHSEREQLSATNNELQVKLGQLSGVNGNLEQIQKQLVGQSQSAESILLELEKLGTIDTVSAAVSHFFRADRSHDGIIDGNEAIRFVSTFTLLKDLVPNFDFKKLQKQVQKYGLSLAQFSVLLSAIVADDPAACREKLDHLYDEEEAEENDPYSCGKPPNSRGVTISPSEVSETTREDSDELFKPWVIGPVRIYGFRHLIFSLLFVIAVGIGIPNLAEYAVDNVVCALATIGIAGYLTIFGQLVVTVRVLKKELRKFHKENAKLLKLNDKLGSEIARLVRLQRGFAVLQMKHAGVVASAQKLLASHRSQSVQSAVGAVTELFTQADANEDLVIDKYEAKHFYTMLEHAFQDVPSFDINKIKAMFSSVDGGIAFERLPELVNVILGQC